jgi:hypothetical protein
MLSPTRAQASNARTPLINPGSGSNTATTGCFAVFFRRTPKLSQFPSIPGKFETMQEAIDLIRPYADKLDRNEGTLAEKAFVELVTKQATQNFKGEPLELQQLRGYFAQVRDECADQVDVPLKSFGAFS